MHMLRENAVVSDAGDDDVEEKVPAQVIQEEGRR
jgi:hypothetical protein